MFLTLRRIEFGGFLVHRQSLPLNACAFSTRGSHLPKRYPRLAGCLGMPYPTVS